MQPRALLLDIDNTIYAYEPCHRAGLAEAQEKAAEWVPLWRDPTQFASSFMRARQEVKGLIPNQPAAHCRLLYFKRMWEQQTGSTALELTMVLHDAYWRGYFSVLRLDPGCLELLQSLRSRGVRIAWVTNYTTERQILKLRALHLEHLTDLLITSEEAGEEKPGVRVLQLALTRLAVEPRDAWLIGDDPSDITAALKLDMMAVQLLRAPGTGGEMAAARCVRSWLELRDLI